MLPDSNPFGGQRRDSTDLFAIMAADLFATLCAVWLALVNPQTDAVRVQAGEAPASPGQQLGIHISSTDIRIDGGPPIDTGDLASSLAAFDGKTLVRIQLDPDNGLAREHAVLAIVTAAGISDIELSVISIEAGKM